MYNSRVISRKKRRLKKSVVRFLKIILAIFIIFIGLKLINTIKIMKKDNETKQIIENIRKNEADNIQESLETLYSTNKDLVGYLIIPDTNINYPVMYTKNEDYYLRRNFGKKQSLAGTLYIDKHNTLKPRDTNLIIYGHNMTKEKTMFHDLEKYKDEKFYQNHKTFIYYTLKEKQEYEIVAVFLSEVYHVTDDVFKYYKFYNAENSEEMEEYYNNIKNISLYDTGVDIEFQDELLTLSTCDYSKENGRLVVVAKRIK